MDIHIDLETVNMIAGTATMLVAVAVSAFKSTRGIARMTERLNSVQPLTDQVSRLREELRSLHAEVQPNHGSSLRDAVNRIELQGVTTAQRLEDHIRDSRYPTAQHALPAVVEPSRGESYGPADTGFGVEVAE